MKKIYLFIITCVFCFSLNAQSQSSVKPDIILKMNGDEMKGKVTKITDNDVTFIYTGETLEYKVKKVDILKIIYSSGRVEIINQPALPSQEQQKAKESVKVNAVDRHNKIAILPFTYLMDNQPGADAIGYKAQEDTYSLLSQHSAGYVILDPRTTNALLIKAGVTKEKMMGYTMKEICEILGVEYIFEGSISQTKGYQTNNSGGSSNTTVKQNGDKDIKGLSTNGSSYSNSAQRYEVTVGLSVYMDTNASIFNQSHKGFFTNTDGSYSSPLQYLVKRCPLYRK